MKISTSLLLSFTSISLAIQADCSAQTSSKTQARSKTQASSKTQTSSQAQTSRPCKFQAHTTEEQTDAEELELMRERVRRIKDLKLEPTFNIEPDNHDYSSKEALHRFLKGESDLYCGFDARRNR